MVFQITSRHREMWNFLYEPLCFRAESCREANGLIINYSVCGWAVKYADVRIPVLQEC
jgi:hypothetical protein